MRIADLGPARPARDLAEAQVRFEALCARDDAAVAPGSGSRWVVHGARVPLAIVLLHGFTSAPPQYDRFAGQLYERGHSVVVPRLPGHGDADRSAAALGRVRAEAWLATADDALDIACGLGERVAILGISLGGVMAAWSALRRTDLSCAVAVAPMFGLLKFPPLVDRIAGAALAALPDARIAWDPFGDGRQIPPYGYPRYSTRGLGQCLRIADAVYERARSERPPAAIVAMLLNARDPAVDNALALEVARRFVALGAVAPTLTLDDLSPIHDIVDPLNPYQRVGEVYPKLIDFLEERKAS